MGKIKEEQKVITGKATKDKIYSSKNRIDPAKAMTEFRRAVQKLYDVNTWSDLPGFTSAFQLFNRLGEEKSADKPVAGDYIKIMLPGPLPANWVVVTDISEGENMAEFTVSPSSDPTASADDRQEVKHFFIKEATSTFRVELNGDTLIGYEIGENEGINNQDEEAGNRKLINTLIAEGGWAGFQKFQWEKLTEYLVHKVEIS